MQFIQPTTSNSIERHEKRWTNCRACPLHINRYKIVLWRGYVPCEVLFIGEAPGHVEDLDGLPFVGPSGQLLDQMIGEATEIVKTSRPIMAFTNIVACLCVESDGKARPPSQEEATACRSRLDEFVTIAQPACIVQVGKTAVGNYRHYGEYIPTFQIEHPASLLRMDNKAGYAQSYLKSVNMLANAFESLIPF